MNEPINPSKRDTRKTLIQRLRPFIRRDLRTRLVSAGAAVLMMVGLAWLGVSALTQMDTSGAHMLRVEAGLEHPYAVCNGPGQPSCSYDDREQARTDEEFALQRRIRAAVLQDLSLRVDGLIDRANKAEDILRDREIDFTNNLQYGGDKELWELLSAPVDLRPMATREDEILALTRLEQAAYFDGLVDRGSADTRDRLLRAIDNRRATLDEYKARIERHAKRDGLTELSNSTVSRDRLLAELIAGRNSSRSELAEWAQGTGGTDRTSADLVELVRSDRPDVNQAITNIDADIWQMGWTVPSREYVAIVPPSVRYASPVEEGKRWRLFGVLLMGLSAIMLLVVSPVVTATTTAREREAGTLPVLRMTGLNASDLAMAMVIGPNVFALATGATLLALGSFVLLFTAGPLALLMPLALMGVFAFSTHLSAIGLGDALGQRVNALIVGALLGLAVVGPGLVGSVMAVFDVAATGLLLGPLPAVMESVAELTALPNVGLDVAGKSLGTTMLTYAIFSQLLLGMICLNTWRRRVEQAWAPLFRPREGITLALVSIGCSALSLLDISNRANTQDFDALNLVTFLSTAFLLPVLGWLLVSSLRRPARASAVASHTEARWAFARFQGLVLVSTGLVGMAYWLVMQNTGLVSEESEVMWATLTQIFLVAQTGVGTLLWTSRRREGKHRAAILGGIVVLLQIVLTIGVYGVEVEHVAKTNTAANPLLLGMDVSPYWLAFLFVMWGAGLAIVVAALMRNRKQADVDEHKLEDAMDEERPAGEMRGRNLIH